MKRREFIALVGAAVAWPLKADANRPDKPRRVGILALFPASDPRVGRQVETMKLRLRELGWREQLNVAFGSSIQTTAPTDLPSLPLSSSRSPT